MSTEETGAPAQQDSSLNVSNLPHDVLASVFLLLGVKDMGRCACVCNSFATVAMDEFKVWLPYSLKRWGPHTNLKKWLRYKGKKRQPLPIAGVFHPQNYRMLSVMLSNLEPMVGLWQSRGNDQRPRGALYRIHWVEDGLMWSKIPSGHHTLDTAPDRILKFGPGTIATGEVLDDTHLIIRDYTDCFVGASVCSGAAVAAASVAVCGLSDTSSEGSPPRSFASEMEKFMNSSILAKGRKKSKKGVGGANRMSTILPECRHMVRVVPPEPTRNTSLAGLWKGIYYAHGLEIIRVDYNFSGSHARIIATKITGDRNVPAGEHTWAASAKAGFQYSLDTAFPYADAELDAKIVACHGGICRVADDGFVNPRSLPGRLFELDNDKIRFQFSDIGFVEYTRLDENLVKKNESGHS
ncbi:hypothetical protein BSKO_04570 [Bryopsis sp. KO-2023]|nr:hypothetical protein BSKO_04570 [Bryopsis sp. KO-2023]